MLTLPSLGAEIAQRRRVLRLTQAELAQRAFISRATLDALENCRIGELGFSKIARLLIVLGLELRLQEAHRPTLEDLLEENAEESRQGRER